MNAFCREILKECLSESSKSENKVFLAGKGEWMELNPQKRDVYDHLNINDYYIDYVYRHEFVDEKIRDHCAVAYHICEKIMDENGNILLIFDATEEIDFV